MRNARKFLELVAIVAFAGVAIAFVVACAIHPGRAALFALACWIASAVLRRVERARRGRPGSDAFKGWPAP